MANHDIKVKESRQDKIFNIVNYSILTFMLLITIYPIIFVVSASFSDPSALMAGKVWLLPKGFTFEGYKVAFQNKEIWIGFTNSAIYTIVGTLINLVITVMAAYPLARKELKGRGLFTLVFAFTMWFSGGLIPTYLVIKDLGILNSRWAIILPAALSVWNMIITKNYFESSIPNEIIESCRIDGCTEIKTLTKVVLPLSKPIIAVIALFYAVSHWNTYFNAFVYLSDRELFPIQVFLREILVMNQATDLISGIGMEEMVQRERLAELLKYSVIVISSLPVILIYPFAQKFFVKGIMVGAVKG